MENNNVISAVFAHYEAKRLEALARLQLYTMNPAGVGDHSNIVEEAVNALADLDSASSAIQTLSSLAAQPPEDQTN